MYAITDTALSPQCISFSEPSASPQGVSILSTSSHSFTMRWDPPPKRQQNGEIVSYEVHYREEGSNSTVVNDTTQGMMYTAEDLTTDRVYQFRVAATTVNGTGPFSNMTEVATIPTGKGGLCLVCDSTHMHAHWQVHVCTHGIQLHGHILKTSVIAQKQQLRRGTLCACMGFIKEDGFHILSPVSVMGVSYTQTQCWGVVYT